MDIIDAVILGLFQGLTEFIPVSSSGHLILADQWFGLNSTFEFDVLLNIGTILALLWYFRQRITGLIKTALGPQKSLASSLLIATLPALVIGGLFKDFFDQNWARNSQSVAAALIVVGAIMIWLEGRNKSQRQLNATSAADGMSIGLAQVLALVPGVSRSGVTIIAGRLRGFDYKSAAEFSFLLSVPILIGAVARVLISQSGQDLLAEHQAQFLAGNLAAFASGLWAVGFMIDRLSKGGLRPFGWYRIILGLLVLIVSF